MIRTIQQCGAAIAIAICAGYLSYVILEIIVDPAPSLAGMP